MFSERINKYIVFNILHPVKVKNAKDLKQRIYALLKSTLIELINLQLNSMKPTTKILTLIAFTLITSISNGQINIPDSEREMVEVGSTGWGVILEKVPNSEYYSFVSDNITGGNCKISFTASSRDLDDLHNFFLSKFGSNSSSTIEIGNREIAVIANENGLYFGEKGVCVFLIQKRIELKNLFGKNKTNGKPNYSLDFLDNK